MEKACAINTILAVQNLSKTFQTRNGQVVQALSNVTFSIPKNSFICIVGPSGCGKSTLLRLMAGLEKSSTGTVTYRGNRQTAPRPEIGMVFQEYSLFPWLSVLDNITFGLGFTKVPANQHDAIGRDFLSLVGLDKYASAMPHELSGGMRQRVAIARALANNPDILLMDEPFGALDAFTRIQLQKRLLDIWERHKKTVVFVTHSVDEAVFLADTIYIMGTNPSCILDKLDVTMERPRTRDNPEFSRLLTSILHRLEQEDEDE